jgi:hypothetical protein
VVCPVCGVRIPVVIAEEFDPRALCQGCGDSLASVREGIAEGRRLDSAARTAALELTRDRVLDLPPAHVYCCDVWAWGLFSSAR